MSGRLLALALLTWTVVPAWPDEICHTQGGQYAETRTCVSSVLPPQGGNTYGPDQITGLGEGAWCEGAPGSGVGQTVTVHQTPVRKIGTIMFVNGYAKTAQTFRANGRVKRARIETSSGAVRVVTLKDTAEMEGIKFPPARVSWIKLTILKVYPGERHADTCISKFYFNQEEFGAANELGPFAAALQVR